MQQAINIQYSLTFETAFHLGTGISGNGANRTVIRDRYGLLYVPGSTFKGVVRNYSEQLASIFTQDQDTLRRFGEPHEALFDMPDLGSTMPITARIYGSRHRPGTLFFNNSTLDTRLFLNKQTEEKDEDREHQVKQINKIDNLVMPYTQVRMSRVTRTAEDGALYTSEFGTRALRFLGQISGITTCTEIPTLQTSDGPAPTYSLLLLLASLLLVENIGGNKSTGKGRCTCMIEAIQVNQTPIAEKDWKHWLKHLELLANYNPVVEDKA